MTGFEYASGLISIVVGLGIARVLGGIGSFLRFHNRAPRDWIVGSWCLVLFLALVGWWMAGWQVLRVQTEISFVTLIFWTIATALLYLSAYLLVPATIVDRTGDLGAFFTCLAAHFGLVSVYMIVALESEFDSPLITGAITIISAAGAAIKTSRGYTLHLAIFVAVFFGAALTKLTAIR